MNMNDLRRIVAEELALSRELKRDDYATASKVLDALADAGALKKGEQG